MTTFLQQLVNGLSLRPFNALYYNINRRRTGLHTVHYEPFLYPLDSILEWNRLYGPSGFFQYQSVVPREARLQATRDMLHAILIKNRAVLRIAKRLLHLAQVRRTLTSIARQDNGEIRVATDTKPRPRQASRPRHGCSAHASACARTSTTDWGGVLFGGMITSSSRIPAAPRGSAHMSSYCPIRSSGSCSSAMSLKRSL
jgi:hypothetical protein